MHPPSITSSKVGAPRNEAEIIDPVENDIAIAPTYRIVVLEGNYIHVTVPPWDQATKLLDEKWFTEVDREVASERVIRRHLIAGIADTEEEARKRFDENDWPNGIYLLENSDVKNADKRIYSVQDRSMSQST
jgi:pantothenate kinase